MIVRDAHTLWQAVLGELQISVPRPSYETWLEGTSGLSFSGRTLVVGAPNAFVSEMLERRMYSVVSRAVEKVVDHSVDLRFEAGNSAGPGTEAAQARQPSPAPNRHPSAARTAPMDPRYTFDTFIVGKSNELAHAAAAAVSERPGVRYNPLFIYSGVGLGKTHLLHSIAGRLAANGVSPIYKTTEDFTNEYIHSIREGAAQAFRDRYRSADAILLDDIQFIIGKEQTQEGFFHTFNALHLAGRQIVITSDRPAAALSHLEDRIRSRLSGGLVVDIQPPDYETRLAILKAKTAGSKLTFPEGVLDMLAKVARANVRELEGCLNRLAAYVELTGAIVTPAMAEQVVSDILVAQQRRISDDSVLEAVAKYYGIERKAIIGRSGDKRTTKARQVTMFLLREETEMPVTAIGRFLSGKSHSTVLHACQTIKSQMDADLALQRDISNIRESLKAA